MLLRHTNTKTTTTTAAIVSLITKTISRHFSTTTTTTTTTNTLKIEKPFSKIPWKRRSKAIQEAQQALIDYLHTTRSMPFVYAEHIVSNSSHSLWKVVSSIPFLPSSFFNSFQRFLRYHPINELEFFLESIGLNIDEDGRTKSCLIADTFFLSDWKQFDVACVLAGLGFPWAKLGLLYKEECSIFEIDPGVLGRRFDEIKDNYGFNSVTVIGLCLAWPRVWYSEMDDLLKDLKIVFVDYDLASSVEGNVDAMLKVCRRIRVFYDLGCEMGKVGELLGKSKSLVLDYSEEVLVSKIEYFCKLSVGRDRIGLFLLSRPEIFGFDLELRVISVSGFLKHFGLKEKELKSLKQKYPHVFGRNRIVNLPNVMRSMDLGEWFFEKMKNGNHYLLNTYAISNMDEDSDKLYADNLIKIRAKRTHTHTIGKLNFLHGIGFGENKFVVKALALANSRGSQLQRRFDYLLHFGFEYSKLCALVRLSAKILNQHEGILKHKLEFLCRDMGSSLEYLDIFPGYLCYDLEKRIKPRYRLHKWLVEQGFCEKEYSISTIIASSEKTFLARISRIYPAAAKRFIEHSVDRDCSATFQKNSVQ